VSVAVASRLGPVRPRNLALLVGSSALLVPAALARPVEVLGVLFIATLAVAVFRWPNQALVLLFAVTPYHNFVYNVLSVQYHLSPQPFTLWKDFLVGALLLRGVAGRLLDGDRHFPRDGGDRFLVGYILFAGVLAVLSSDMTIGGYAFATIVEGPLFFLAILALRPSREVMRACVIAALLAASIMAIIGIIEQNVQDRLPNWFGRYPAKEEDYHAGTAYRSGSLIGDPLPFAFYMGAIIPVAAACVGIARRWWRLGALVALGTCMAGIAVTYTRSGYIGAALGLVIVIALAVRERRIRLVLLGMTVVIAGAVATVAVASGDQRISHGNTAQTHIDRLRTDLDLIANRPMGYGIGRFDYLGRRFNTPEAAATSATESVYLERAVEGGVAALVLYLIALFWTGMRLRRARRLAIVRGDSEARIVAAAALATLVSIAAAGINLPVQELYVDVVVWGVAGFALVMGRSTKGAPPPTTP
jgi:hypothetical protein